MNLDECQTCSGPLRHACPFCRAGVWGPTPTAGRLGCTSCGAVALPGRGFQVVAHTPPASHCKVCGLHVVNCPDDCEGRIT